MTISKEEKDIINILKKKVKKNYLSFGDNSVVFLNCDEKRLFITMKDFSYNMFQVLPEEKQKEVYEEITKIYPI